MGRFIIFILHFEIETDIMIILNLQIKKKKPFREMKYPIQGYPRKNPIPSSESVSSLQWAV